MIFEGRADNGTKVFFNDETLEISGRMTTRGLQNLAEEIAKYYGKKDLEKGLLRVILNGDRYKSMRERKRDFDNVVLLSKKLDCDFMELCSELFPFIGSYYYLDKYRGVGTISRYREIVKIDRKLVKVIFDAIKKSYGVFSEYANFILEKRELIEYFKDVNSLILLSRTNPEDIEKILDCFDSPEHLSAYCRNVLENEFLMIKEFNRLGKYPSYYKKVYGEYPKRFPKDILSEFEKVERKAKRIE